MTEPQREMLDNQPPRARTGGILGGPHFIVAAAILLITAAGWGIVVHTLKLWTEKYPVPWPVGVEVGDGYVNTSMPDKMGPYVLAEDGELDYDGQGGFRKDGLPDGEGSRGIRKDVMELLGIGTPTDETNLPLRRSNWLSVRTYRDNDRPPGDPLRYWRLEVYYYTGGVDLVPHVPEVCNIASGAIHVGTTPRPIRVEGLDGPWGEKPLAFQRALFEKGDVSAATQQYVQYYIFSVNGKPVPSSFGKETIGLDPRNEVRLMLGSLFVKHAYFAKIQFAPVPVVQKVGERLVFELPDPGEADKAAADFVTHFMPHILKTLPTAQDIAKLDEGGQGKKSS